MNNDLITLFVLGLIIGSILGIKFYMVWQKNK